MQLHFFAMIIATIIEFIIGAVWYGFLFGKLWGKIHGFDKLLCITLSSPVNPSSP